MNRKNQIVITAFGLLFVGATSASAQTTFGFKGDCQSTAAGAEPLTFDVDLHPGTEAVLPIVEEDGFGVEVVTNIVVSFPISSVLIVRFTTDMPAPFNGDVSAQGVMPGAKVRALFPTRLGGQAECQGTVTSRTVEG